jgi:hypothetical protein
MAALSAPGRPEGALVKIVRKTIFAAYMTVCVVGLIFGPLIVLHGYRAWWLDAFDAALVFAVVAGTISHYRTDGRNGHSEPVH